MVGADGQRPACRKTFVVVASRGAGTAANQGSSPSRRHFWKLTDPKGRQGSAEGHLGGVRKSISDIPNISKDLKLSGLINTGPQKATWELVYQASRRPKVERLWLPNPQSQLQVSRCRELYQPLSWRVRIKTRASPASTYLRLS